MTGFTSFVCFFAFVTAVKTADPLCVGYPSDQEITFASPTSCTHYFRCFNGTFSERICPLGTYYSAYNAGCVDPEFAECMGGSGAPVETTTPTTETTTESEVDPRCSGQESSYWPHPAFCHLYIECYLGASYEMECPPGRYFSAAHNSCVSADESECCLNHDDQCQDLY